MAESVPLLESYAAGRWFAADDEGRPLLDASTGEEVVPDLGRRASTWAR